MEGPAMADVDHQRLEARVHEILNRWPAVGLVLGVVGRGAPELYCHGVADVEANTAVTEETAFRIGSITKTFTAVAVMQLWERGLVDLDAPANDYLRALPAGLPKGELAARDRTAPAHPFRRAG